MTGLFAASQDINVKKMITHMLGAARFSADTFKQLRDDPTTTLQSIILVPITGLSYGVGLGLYGFFVVGFSVNDMLLTSLLSLISAGVIAIIWSCANFLVVTKLFNRTIGYMSLTRPFLFSWTPGLLFILLLIPNPSVSEIFRVLATAWLALASIFAVRYASGLTLQQSMITFIVCILILALAQIVFASLLPLFFT